MKRNIKSYIKAAACFLLFLFVQVVGGVVALFLANYQQIASGEPLEPDVLTANPQWLGIGLLVADLIAVLLLWATTLIRRRPLPRKSPVMPYKWAVPLGAFLLMSMGLSLLVTPLNLDDGGVAEIFKGMSGSVVCLLTLTVIGPIIEELIFREGIQRHLKAAGLSPALAIGITAVLFGLAHGNVAQGVMAFVLGIVLGLFYERTGDIRLSVPAHILNNTLGVVLFYFPDVEDGMEQMQSVPLVCGGLLLVISAAWLIYKWWAVSLTKIPPVSCE